MSTGQSKAAALVFALFALALASHTWWKAHNLPPGWGKSPANDVEALLFVGSVIGCIWCAKTAIASGAHAGGER